VWAWVPENHLSSKYGDNKRNVLTRVKITGVDKFNPVCTYRGIQKDRRWSANEKFKMQYINGKGFIGCSLNDTLIVEKVVKGRIPDISINNYVDTQGFLLDSYPKFADINTL